MARIHHSIITLTLLASPLQQAFADQHQDLAALLRWQPDPQSICRGHFAHNPEVARISHPPAMTDARTTITAAQGATLSARGTSILKGHVRVRQPGRELNADQVRLIRPAPGQNISHIDLKGRVRFEEHDRLFTADQAHADLDANTFSAWSSAYRTDHPTPHELLHAWGSAECAHKDGCGTITLTNTTYSVCPITHPTWQIRAKNITLDKQTGVATAHHARFYLHGIPIFYLPWISYPIKPTRKSGLLLPGTGYSERDGFSLDLPLYLNLAPNYDALVSFNPMSKRGIKLNGSTRYLTQHNHGEIALGFIPRDRQFLSFQRSAPQQYADQPEFSPFLSRINNASTDRLGAFLRHSSTFNTHWAGSLDINYVSDDYYMRDFGSNPLNSNKNQLLNQAELHYADEHWQCLGRIKGYQTLHPIGSMNPELYSRVPQFAAAGFYPCSTLGLDYELWLDYTHFDHRRNFITNRPVVTGHRLHVRPGIGKRWSTSWGYCHPMLRTDATQYWLRDQPLTSADTIGRTLPIATIDTGLIFEREGSCYRQTLEPRAYYLWVPKQSQDDIPIFDTTLPRFSFEQLFYYNRFAGFDRFGDANQLTLALASRWYEASSGIERFTTNIGIVYQFQKRSVCLTPDGSDDPTRNQKLSPVLMNATYRFTPTTYAQADVGWSPVDLRTETGNMRLHYEPNPNQIMHIGYDFVRDGDDIADAGNHNLSRLDLGLSWPVMAQWQVLANWNYNLSHRHIQHYLFGIGYDSCCWALRAIISRTELSLTHDDNSRYNMNYYLEIKLKGLGTLGNARPSTLLDSSLVGYHDHFR